MTLKVWNAGERVSHTDLNSNFASSVQVNDYLSPSTIVAPIGNTNVLHPVYSRLSLQGERPASDTDPTHLYWMGVIGLYNESGGPVTSGAPVSNDVALYLGAMQGGGGSRNAGGIWGLNIEMNRGALPNPIPSVGPGPGAGAAGPGNTVAVSVPTIGLELDYCNWDRDCAPGGAFTVGLYVSTLSTFTSLAAQYYDSSGAVGWHNGLFFSGSTIVDNTIFDNSGSNVGYYLQGAHPVAAFLDSSTGAQSILITGLKTAADITITTNSPAAINMTGSRSVAAIQDVSTGPRAIRLAGTHTAVQIDCAGVAPVGYAATGTFAQAAFSAGTATTPIAYAAAAGQSVTFNGIFNTIKWDVGSSKFLITNNANAVIASLDNSGNLRCLGTVTGSVTP